MADFALRQGQLSPRWEADLFAPDGSPFDLHGAAVVLRYSLLDGTGTARETACTVLDPFVGKIRVDWVAGDTAVAGVYDAWFVVTPSGGTAISVPATWGLVLEISPAV